MSLSANFPHQLALLVVALQTDKLPICEHLEDPTEKSIVGSLMTRMNNRDFRTPITISRKTLGQENRVKRSTLFNKLRSLKEKGLIEDEIGERPIRFTEKAIALMQLEWTKQADRWKEKQVKKTPMFRVGNSSFPQDLIQLINRGVSEGKLRGLLSEAKKAGKKLQNILRDFESSLSRYSGDDLFFVIRHIICNPHKYEKIDKITHKKQTGQAAIDERQIRVLQAATDNDDCILMPDEQLRNIDNVWHLSTEASGYTPKPVDSATIAMLEDRMRSAVLTYAGKHQCWEVGSSAHGAPMRLDREESEGKPWPTMLLPDGKRLRGSWETLYRSLPLSARQVSAERKQDPRIGRKLIRRGVSYFVEGILAGVAHLRMLSGPSEGRTTAVTVDNLQDPEIAWLKK